MQIPNAIRKCVVFLGYRDRNDVEHIRGTAFLLNDDDTRPESGVGESYLVTAKHNLIKVQNTGATKVLIRANTKTGTATVIESALTDWICDSADPCLDVAVLPLGPISQDILKLDVLVFPKELFVTSNLIKEMPITIGNQVIIPGLFSEHYGEYRNIPIVRCGNIAAMQEEKIKVDWFDTKVDIDAYLIEARSLGGLSGSPVFVYVDHIFRPEADGTQQRVFKPEPRLYFLGLVHGHYDTRYEHLRSTGSTRDSINLGLAIVVPTFKIAEVLEQPRLKEKRSHRQ